MTKDDKETTATVIDLASIREARRVLDNNEPSEPVTLVLNRWEAVQLWGCAPEIVANIPRNGIAIAPNGERIMLMD